MGEHDHTPISLIKISVHQMLQAKSTNTPFKTLVVIDINTFDLTIVKTKLESRELKKISNGYAPNILKFGKRVAITAAKQAEFGRLILMVCSSHLLGVISDTDSCVKT